MVEGRGPVDLEIGVVAGSFQVNQDISIPVALSLIEGTAIGNIKLSNLSSSCFSSKDDVINLLCFDG